MQEVYLKNIALSKPGGNASKGALRGMLAIPKEVLEDMGIDTENRAVVLEYNTETKELTVRKETVEDCIL